MNPCIRSLVLLMLLAFTVPAAAQQLGLVRVIGSLGSGPGQFDYPHNMAIDSEGNILVADFRNNRIQKLDPDGDFLLQWGNSPGPGELVEPIGVAIDSSDNVYVVELTPDRVQKFNSQGNFLTQWGSDGNGSGQFNNPSGIAVDGNDDVWVVDQGNNRIQKFTSNGTFIASFGVGGSGNGQFDRPTGVGIAGNGDVLIAEQRNHRIQRFDSAFSFVDSFGSQGSGSGLFRSPSDVAVAGDGRIFVADTNNHRIQVFSASGAYLEQFGGLGSGPGQFDQPRGIVVSGDLIFVADRDNNRLQVFSEDAVAVDEKISGSWFDPSNDGEGWKIEILPNGLAVIYWFTYPPPGFSGEQAWIGGVGRIEGSQIIVEEADSFIATGGVFGDPDRNATISTWGSFTFTFEDQDNGTMDYVGPTGWGSGGFDIVRLTNVATTAASAETNLGKGISGSWIASQDLFRNEGWLIEVIGPKSALIYWFTYDESGNQAWNLGVGTIVANSILVFNPIVAFGTVFGAGFDPNDVVRSPWGSYVFTFEDCNNGVITYGSQKGMGFSQVELTRLTTLAGAPCTDFVRTKGEDKPTIGAVCTNPDDPTLLISFRDDGHNGLFFGDKSANGLAESLDKILVPPIPGADGEADTVIDVMDGGMMTMVADVSTGNSVQVELNQTNDDIVLTGLNKDGDLQSIVAANLAALFGPGAGRKASSGPAAEASGRTGPVRVWSSPLKAAPAGPLPSGSVDSLNVVVNRCGAPFTDARVTTTITSDQNAAVKVVLAGRQVSDGVYNVPLPTSQASAARQPDDEDEQCGAFVDQAGDACALFDRLQDRNFPLLCATSAAGMAADQAPESKLARATEFFISCASALGSGKLACDSAGSEQAAGGQSRRDFVCGDAVSADRALDGPLFMLDRIQLETTVSFPGSDIPDIPFMDRDSHPADGPFPDYNFILDGDPSVDKFFTTPSDPDPRQGYRATARVGCLLQNSIVDMSVTGSDGFTGFGSCVISGNGECHLDVPASGRQASLRDTITVTLPDGVSREIQVVF